MKPNSSDLLAAFYARHPPSWLEKECIERFYDESDRRIMDIAGRLWKSWPIGSCYAEAKYGDSFTLGVAAGFLSHCHTVADVSSAVRSSLEDWLLLRNDFHLAGIFRYEGLLHVQDRKPYLGTLRLALIEREKLPEGFSLDIFDFDVLEFSRILQRYANAHAPAYMYRLAQPRNRTQVLASYSRDGKIFAREVTAEVHALAKGDLRKVVLSI